MSPTEFFKKLKTLCDKHGVNYLSGYRLEDATVMIESDRNSYYYINYSGSKSELKCEKTKTTKRIFK